MSDFFEATSKIRSAESLERELRDEERRFAQRRRTTHAFIVMAVLAAVLVGGSLAAFAATHGSAKRAAVGVSTPLGKKAAPAQKHKRHARAS